MPLVTLETQAPTPAPAELAELLRQITASTAEHLSKPEHLIMVSYKHAEAMTLAQSSAPCCYLSVFGVGQFDPARMNALSQALCEHIERCLDVCSDRVFIVFNEVERTHWAVRGRTLA
ncbi:MAG: hypothetical protein RJA70_4136 [Pseudomonadota bacterium]|jgi:phenylpyruvate tautomerase PptA (4-oxalocrotonate tautomerase family)